MKKIVVPVDCRKWDDFRIVKLVHKVGNCVCNVNIQSGKKYINVKSISSMMDYFHRLQLSKNIEIYLEGFDEEATALWLTDFFEQ